MKPVIAVLMMGLLLWSCQKDVPELPKESVITEQFSSSITNVVYNLHIYLPPNYDAAQSYPVIYQLDGDYSMQPSIDAVEDLVANQQMSPAIIVGIDYSGENLREQDFTPTANEGKGIGGGAAAFYQFFHQVLPNAYAYH